jgi:hypothetical protein
MSVSLAPEASALEKRLAELLEVMNQQPDSAVPSPTQRCTWDGRTPQHAPPPGGFAWGEINGEPSAGRGAIVRELLRMGARDVDVVEIDAARLGRLSVGPAAGLGLLLRGDFLRLTADDFSSRFDLIVMNPPFGAAEAHVAHALTLLKPGGVCAALLRLAFCAGAKRAPFRRAHPFDLYPLARRPSFTAESLSWMTEEDLRAQARTVGPAACETLAEVRARLKGTDSAD